MHTISFECETVTPMFLAGADGSIPELRAPSLKGALRFWWRAMNGHLTEDVLRQREGVIFGDTTRRSCFSLHVQTTQDLFSIQTPPVPHKGFPAQALNTGTAFKVVFRIIPINTVDFSFNEKQLKSLFEITVLLGGMGKRVRRGMGSYKITMVDNTPYAAIRDTKAIYPLIQQHTKHYVLKDGLILLNYHGAMLRFPWIQRIETGASQPNMTRVISNATHEVKKQTGNQYEPNMGHANNGRFASPVFVSILGDGQTPVITTLNTIPDRGRQFLDAAVQEQFRSEILQPK